VKITLIILAITAILLSEPLVLGYMNYRGNTTYLFSSFGFNPKYENVIIEKNGLEVRACNYSRLSENDLEINIVLYSYNTASFDCSGTMDVKLPNWNVGYDIYASNEINSPLRVFSIKEGENNIKIPTAFSEDELAGLTIGLNLRNPWKNIYSWRFSDVVGESSYRANPLFPDKYVSVQNGYTYSPEKLSNTILYYWLPTMAIIAIGYSAYRIRKWVKEVNNLKLRINP
jgi:hypothetical protein